MRKRRRNQLKTKGDHTRLNCWKHRGVGNKVRVRVVAALIPGISSAMVHQEGTDYERATHRRARIACWSEFRKWMPSRTRALITSMPVVAPVVAVIISVVVLARWAERAGGMFRRLLSHLGADLDAGPIMHPAVHARVDHLVERLRESRVGAHRRGYSRDLGVNCEAQRVRVVKAPHGPGLGAAESALRSWLIGMDGG